MSILVIPILLVVTEECILYNQYKYITSCQLAMYHMEENFGRCKLWHNGEENFIGRINFGSFTMIV